jgi:acyl-CoA synthetase (AMP-forming)/AMP-acid ligase II
MATLNSPLRLQDILNTSANKSAGIYIYTSETLPPEYLSYQALRSEAILKATQLQRYHGFTKGGIVLIHFHTQREDMVWFWATLFAGCVPCMSTPLVQSADGRKAHLKHLHELLEDPLVVTSKNLLSTDLAENTVLRYATTAELQLQSKPGAVETSSTLNTSTNETSHLPASGTTPSTLQDDIAILMLTSGSTGFPKAVPLSHTQILTACTGKLSHMPLPPSSAVLNWVGLDHVGSLTELHITAILAGCDQVHVATTEVVADPLALLRLLSKHKVARTFAPHFMLARLDTLLKVASENDTRGIALQSLLYLISGGEANTVEICRSLSGQLQRLGAPNNNSITPGFGMTETCAGCIYNLSCPAIDIQAGTEFASLGTCIPGLSMRVNAESELEISGPVVFRGYLKNPEATRKALTSDGWFRTGDTATIDKDGRLRLLSRLTDLVVINGIKHALHPLEAAINQLELPGIAPGFVVCFALRPPGADTEEIQVVYQRAYNEQDVQARRETKRSGEQVVAERTRSLPRVLPLAPGRLQRSTLGKLSRARVKAALVDGEYADDVALDARLLASSGQEETGEVGLSTTEERMLMQVLRELGFGVKDNDTEETTWDVLDAGMTSVELIRVKREIERAFGMDEIPIATILNNTNVRDLAAAIGKIRIAGSGR